MDGSTLGYSIVNEESSTPFLDVEEEIRIGGFLKRPGSKKALMPNVL
jgi:hypothetical protein